MITAPSIVTSRLNLCLTLAHSATFTKKKKKKDQFISVAVLTAEMMTFKN